jgi:quinol monooxygenase YgiN
VTQWPPVDPTDVTAVTEQRDDLVAAVRDHAGRIAYRLARLQGGDYGSATIETARGEWTVKYEGGDLEYLRYDPGRGGEIYVISTKQPPEPTALADALEDYDAFVAGFNEFVATNQGVLDDVTTDFPEVETTGGVVAERDRVLGQVREVCDRIARQLRRYEGGDYGTFTERVEGTRWELKWDQDGASYLRVGGTGGLYLLSQYEPPSAVDIHEYAPLFPAFVTAYNDHVAGLESDLETIEL